MLSRRSTSFSVPQVKPWYVLLLSTLLVSGSPLFAQLAEESLQNPPEVVSLTWAEVPRSTDLATHATPTTYYSVRNETEKFLALELEAIGDAGNSKTVRTSLGGLSLEPGQLLTLPLDLQDLELDLDQMRFAGQLLLAAKVSHRDELDWHQVLSPPLFFHRDSASPAFSFYGEAVLHDRFRSGDLRSAMPSIDEPGTVTDRVLSVATDDLPSGSLGKGISAAPWLPATTCVRWQAQTVDSGHPIPNGPKAGSKEDWFKSCDGGCTPEARGVRVKMSLGGWSQTFDASPTSGCFSWFPPVAYAGYTMRVYGYSTDSAGNYIRIHDNPSSFATYPGKTYSIVLNGVPAIPGAALSFNVGSYDRKWTAMAALGFSLYRFHDGLSDKAFHVGLDTSTCGASSAHFGSSNASITSGRHYLKLGACATGSAQASRKFIVAHEYGHAAAALYYGAAEGAVNGGEPAYDGSHDVDPNACGIGGTSYSMRTKEWNTVGFREGFAHFIAAKIWNNKNPEGAFRWFENQTYDLERWDFGGGAGSGGRLENECCISGCGTSYTDAGTNEDWMRFFWDFYTNVHRTCTDQPSKLDMMKLYRQTRLNGGLNSTNYFDKMRTAAAEIGLEDCLAGSRFDSYAAHNGIDN